MNDVNEDNQITCGFDYRNLNDRVTRLIFFLSFLGILQVVYLLFLFMAPRKPHFYTTTRMGVVRPIQPASQTP
jgi:hypothetical protein